MEERMNCLWTIRKFAKWKFETDEPTVAQENTVRKMCQDKTLPAAKVGQQWRIDVSRILEAFDGN